MWATTSTNVRSRRQVLSLGLAAAALAACTPKAPKGQVHRIVIANMAFGAVPPALAVGDTIEWVNQDIFEHTATARDGAFDVDLKPHDRAHTKVRRTSEVYCRFHPGMTLTLAVAP